jgi:hypothetical protein
MAGIWLIWSSLKLGVVIGNGGLVKKKIEAIKRCKYKKTGQS